MTDSYVIRIMYPINGIQNTNNWCARFIRYIVGKN